MTISTTRQRLHHYLETADDKTVKAIYTIIEKDIEHSGVFYNSELKSELKHRHKNYLENPKTAISPKESKRRVEAILKSANNNAIRISVFKRGSSPI